MIWLFRIPSGLYVGALFSINYYNLTLQLPVSCRSNKFYVVNTRMTFIKPCLWIDCFQIRFMATQYPNGPDNENNPAAHIYVRKSSPQSHSFGLWGYPRVSERGCLGTDTCPFWVSKSSSTYSVPQLYTSKQVT